MSKLKIVSDRGSTLVAVVVFAIVLAVAGAGYLTVMSTTVNHETSALDEQRAYLTAESGLLTGIRWLRDSTNWTNRTNLTGPLFIDSINGMRCSVSLEISSGVTRVVSRVTGSRLNYRKELTYSLASPTVHLGTFINSIYPANAANTHEWGGGGLVTSIFDGPVHSNGPLIISSTNSGSLHFNDRVSVHNQKQSGNPSYHFNLDNNNVNTGGHWGDFGVGNSDYSFGILVNDIQAQQGTNQSKKLDPYFSSEFLHSADSLYMPDIVSQDQILPISASASDTAFLEYKSDGTARYSYFTAPGVKTVLSLSSAQVNGKILRAKNTIAVIGTILSGVQTTLVTDSGKTIVLAGNLTYSGFDTVNAVLGSEPLNYGVDTASASVVSLVSGGNFYIPPNLKKVNGTGSLESSTQTNLFLTAAVYAENLGHGILMKTKNGQFDKTAYPNKFKFYSVGSRTVDTWFNVGANVAGMFNWYYDRRFTGGLKGPGVPDVQAYVASGADGLKIFNNGVWSENNVPL